MVMLELDQLVSREELVELFMRYLDSKHTSGWGRYFSITEKEGCREAAEWAIDHFIAMIQMEESELADG